MSSKSFEWTYESTTVELPCFTMDEYANLQAKAAKWIKQQNRTLAAEIGFLNDHDRAKFIRDSDPKSISPLEVEHYVNDDRHARDILKFSLTKAGKQPEEADTIIATMNVMERCAIAKHVAGLIDLQPIPEEDRKASERMEALIRRNYSGVEPGQLTVGKFYYLIEQLILERGEGDRVRSWFNENTVGGTSKELVA